MVQAVDQVRADVDKHLDSLEAVAELSDARYHQTHETFEAASNQRQSILAWFRRFLKAEDRPLDSNCLELLSVGCGGGVMDRRIADVLGESYGPVSITGIDPNERHIAAFSKGFEGAIHRAEGFSGGFEDFQSDRRFDLVYFLHCLYYFDRIEPSLVRAIHHMQPGGAVLVLQAPNGALNHLADRVWRKQFGQSAWYSDDVMKVLDAQEGRVSCERIDAEVDVTPCFDSNDPLGMELLDFVVQAETRKFSETFRALLRESLRAICRAREGRLYVPHPVDAIVFRKS